MDLTGVKKEAVQASFFCLSVVHRSDDLIGKALRKDPVQETLRTGNKVNAVQRLDFFFSERLSQ